MKCCQNCRETQRVAVHYDVEWMRHTGLRECKREHKASSFPVSDARPLQPMYLSGNFRRKSKGGLDEELEELVLLEFFAISVLTYLHIIFSVVREISVALNIPVLTVPREKWKAS